MRNIELLLKANLIHGDLSPFNVLLWRNRLCVIDFPQAVDPRNNLHAFALLNRDIANVCRYFARIIHVPEAGQLAENLWSRYVRAEL
jgi:RIO kinase 1